MRIGGFGLFNKTNARHHWNIAGWHSPHSMTWRWVVSFRLFGEGEWRVRPVFGKCPHGGGIQATLRIPFVGMLSLVTQQPMWYRDCYRRVSAKLDRALRAPR